MDGPPRGIESPFVGAIGTPEYVASPEIGVEAERQELDWLLTSGVLGRSGNLARVLKYICEERFAGRAQQIKEYTIATQALGRRPDFDPNSDTIVRVTVHSLRKRLLEVYQDEGAGRPMRLVLPPGHYDPRFVPAPPLHPPPAADHLGERALAAPLQMTPWRPQASARRVQLWGMGTFAIAVAIAVSAVWGLHRRAAGGLGPADTVSYAVATPPPSPQATIRALMGAGRQPYVDHSGLTWVAGNYCQGAANVIVPPQKIEGTLDAPLYLGGMRGIAHCAFPVTQKLYELHFYFAETSDLPAVTRRATLSINSGPAVDVDVVDDAGGDGIATSTVVTGITPENDEMCIRDRRECLPLVIVTTSRNSMLLEPVNGPAFVVLAVKAPDGAKLGSAFGPWIRKFEPYVARVCVAGPDTGRLTRPPAARVNVSQD